LHELDRGAKRITDCATEQDAAKPVHLKRRG